ncbi:MULTISPECIES: cytochrome c-type biogenesis protein [unclassified Neptuniibacter]|jgi:cytochrome c-type biogenesis protein CcmH|uniref:cytochrome c-type biogenesis protein n=1 Tax=unclassified Neptuniibacter TaxID=2630693 RepID=UPI0026E40E56|nr:MULTISPECIES: cytochrome c-type biogenesis protein [unclassified Neptuniibacter]MDO6515578.1 cytochrome c-type biogenesis protein CcmH [Neptuniibacter sp. 2_MG-2023]MDO6595250.1 cytochrome c-type biogenesis protein CcmH [Neptuniibacter sp. 1_MG-2023]
MRYLVALIVIFIPLSVFAAIDTFEFKDDATRERFNELTFELRCPKCQNQNLQDSNSPIAADLRNEVYKMVQDGKDNNEIKDFLVARYGEFVLYNPPVNETTYILWYGPFGLVVIGIIVLIAVSRKRKRSDQEDDSETHLNNDEAERLNDILGKGEQK